MALTQKKCLLVSCEKVGSSEFLESKFLNDISFLLPGRVDVSPSFGDLLVDHIQQPLVMTPKSYSIFLCMNI